MVKTRNKDKSVFVRMTREEREICKKAKGQANAPSLSEWARDVLLREAQKVQQRAAS